MILHSRTRCSLPVSIYLQYDLIPYERKYAIQRLLIYTLGEVSNRGPVRLNSSISHVGRLIKRPHRLAHKCTANFELNMQLGAQRFIIEFKSYLHEYADKKRHKENHQYKHMICRLYASTLKPQSQSQSPSPNHPPNTNPLLPTEFINNISRLSAMNNLLPLVIIHTHDKRHLYTT